MNKKYYFVLIVLVLLIIIGLFIYFRYNSVPKDYDLTTQYGCEKLGGKWDYIGLGSEKECNILTSDVGNICYDRSDCEGECIAELSNEELKLVINQSISKNGMCSEYRIVLGCRYFVNNGNVDGLLCVD